jgi:hypothetical protein
MDGRRKRRSGSGEDDDEEAEPRSADSEEADFLNEQDFENLLVLEKKNSFPLFLRQNKLECLPPGEQFRPNPIQGVRPEAHL